MNNLWSTCVSTLTCNLSIITGTTVQKIIWLYLYQRRRYFPSPGKKFTSLLPLEGSTWLEVWTRSLNQTEHEFNGTTAESSGIHMLTVQTLHTIKSQEHEKGLLMTVYRTNYCMRWQCKQRELNVRRLWQIIASEGISYNLLFINYKLTYS